MSNAATVTSIAEYEKTSRNAYSAARVAALTAVAYIDALGPEKCEALSQENPDFRALLEMVAEFRLADAAVGELLRRPEFSPPVQVAPKTGVVAGALRSKGQSHAPSARFAKYTPREALPPATICWNCVQAKPVRAPGQEMEGCCEECAQYLDGCAKSDGPGMPDPMTVAKGEKESGR